MHITSHAVPFAGNDYLGLARDPRLVQALHEAAQRYGIGSTSSRWALGWTELHERLEKELAAFFGTEDACILGATYHGGPAYFEVLARRAKAVYVDEHAHANLLLGLRAFGFDLHAYRHLDAEDLKARLKRHAGPPPVVATDGVCSIGGELPALEACAEAARSAEAEFLVDDAHGVFAVGANGRGAPEVCGLRPGSFTLLGSMSKALGCNGGFLAGKKDLVEGFRRSAAACGTSVPPPPIAAACLRALEIVRAEPERRARMETHAARMRACLGAHGIAVVCERTPIVTMMLSGEAEAAEMSSHFLRRGLRIPFFKYPSEPRHNLLRAIARANYSNEELSRFEEAVAAWRKR